MIIINNPIIVIFLLLLVPIKFTFCNYFLFGSKVFIAIRFGIFFQGEIVH
jgi:hypothetical protein